ncbi:MAG: hypothetical protein ACRDK3_10965 [Actinomycetota bacterium]
MNEPAEPRTVLLIGGDLMARARIEGAAAAASLKVESLTAEALGSLDRLPEADLVVLDLDTGGSSLIRAWAELSGGAGPRTIGYFSHVDVELGRQARTHGIEAWPRGRFWRTLDDIFAAV